MTELIENLEAERRRLQLELAADPRNQKIKAIDELLALYVHSQPAVAAVSHSPKANGSLTTSEEPTATSSITLTKAEQMKRAISLFLESKGSAHRAELLKNLQTAGLMGSGGDQMGQLAAYLSKWRSEFSSDGKGNFSLTQRPPTTNDADSPKNQGSDTSASEPS